MLKNHISIPVVLSEKNFKDFILYDSMTKNKRYKTTLSITIMLFTLATLCFASQEHLPAAEIIGNILIVFTVLIPTNYTRTFQNSVKTQTEKMKLNPPRQVYTINLSTSSAGIHYFYPQETKAAGQYAWKSIDGAYKTGHAIYLYVTPQQALIIPDTIQAPDYETIWRFIKSNLNEKQIHEKQKAK